MTTEQQLQQASEPLLARFGDMLKWQWDEREKVLLSEFSVDKQDQALMILQQHFSQHWDHKQLRKASPEFKHRASHFSRLQKGQMLFGCGQTPILAAWWPWGHGATVSIRLFAPNPKPFIPAKGLKGLLQKLF